jgi:hypothetical protein
LIILLKREIAVYRELQDAIYHEKTILMKPSLERLLESNNKKETVILKAKMLEDGRLKVIRKIAKILALEENEVNLTILCSYADNEQREYLQECRSILSSLLARNRDTRRHSVASRLAMRAWGGWISVGELSRRPSLLERSRRGKGNPLILWLLLCFLFHSHTSNTLMELP